MRYSGDVRYADKATRCGHNVPGQQARKSVRRYIGTADGAPDGRIRTVVRQTDSEPFERAGGQGVTTGPFWISGTEARLTGHL
jgi:hypothetical protein